MITDLKKKIALVLKNYLNCHTVKKLFFSSGSALNQCCAFDTDRGTFFVKVNSADKVKMFEAEAQALRLIEKSQTLTVPTFRYCGKDDTFAYLILDYVTILPHTEVSQKRLGEQLAKMHLKQRSKNFGFPIDNTLGTTLQKNPWTASWIQFLKEARFEFQFQLIDSHYQDQTLLQMGKNLLPLLPNFFEEIEVKPSLLHGDLWSGNTGCTEKGDPIVFDPASYYGHQEADLSMMGMFGGFTDDFYNAYHAAIPKEKGFEERQKLYQLYHYLNHYNLFGTTYRHRCLSLLKEMI